MTKNFGTLRAPSALEPRLGPLDAAAIVVSNVIGGGMFFVPQVVAGMVPHPWAILGVWLLGGLLSFAGAMAYAELAAARPRAGAEYVYQREAFGRLPAFLTGWTSFVAGFSVFGLTSSSRRHACVQTGLPRARATLVGATLVAGALGGTAQAATAPAQATAVAAEAIRVDGVLDPKEWARAVPIGVLVQRDPVEGAPASEETEVRVAFDGDNLYFGILCRDRTPDAIVATQLGRDADLAVDDRVTIVLDPFFDQRNGFFFSVNPAGARADGQISNNEQEPSLEWDGIWDARTRITSEGWAAEVALPFKTLRFKPGQATWGLNVERQIKRLDERDRWASARFDAWISNLAEAGQLGGLTGLQQGRGSTSGRTCPAGRR